MNPTSALACFALLCALSAGGQAQEASAAPAGTRGGEPNVKHTVIEDDSARIEELRVRGQTVRISVSPKGSQPGYEIIPAEGFRDMSESAGSSRGAAGKRVWRVLSF